MKIEKGAVTLFLSTLLASSNAVPSCETVVKCTFNELTPGALDSTQAATLLSACHLSVEKHVVGNATKWQNTTAWKPIYVFDSNGFASPNGDGVYDPSVDADLFTPSRQFGGFGSCGTNGCTVPQPGDPQNFPNDEAQGNLLILQTTSRDGTIYPTPNDATSTQGCFDFMWAFPIDMLDVGVVDIEEKDVVFSFCQ